MSVGSLDDSVVVQFEISVAGYFQFSCVWPTFVPLWDSEELGGEGRAQMSYE